MLFYIIFWDPSTIRKSMSMVELSMLEALNNMVVASSTSKLNMFNLLHGLLGFCNAFGWYSSQFGKHKVVGDPVGALSFIIDPSKSSLYYIIMFSDSIQK